MNVLSRSRIQWHCVILVFFLALTTLAKKIGGFSTVEMTTQERRELQSEAADMFYHGYNAYLENAFPWDELMPLSCTGRRWDQRSRGDLDDTLGGYSLTLIDSLDMLVVLGDQQKFESAVRKVIETVHFDRDVRVSVFETTIRVLGGLLSAHSLAIRQDLNLVPEYLSYKRPEKYQTAAKVTGKGALLDMALDVAERLFVAFDTSTGIPIHRVNLKGGKIDEETDETCPAAAGSLLLEMALLSRLSGIPKYEEVARNAVLQLWKRRSKTHDLLGSTINVESGKWVHGHTGIGAGLDSFYEYLFKYYILSGDTEWLEMFQISYKSIEAQLVHGEFHIEVDMHHGKEKKRFHRVSALQAFWPGLQVLAGDVKAAVASHRKLLSLWVKYSAMPEVYDLTTGTVIHWAKNYPLRPELAESTFHLWEATRDPYYLSVGKRILLDIQNHTRVECGYASIADIHTKELEDRMDSYFLSETVKYLYLLFKDVNDPLVPVAVATSNSFQAAVVDHPKSYLISSLHSNSIKNASNTCVVEEDSSSSTCSIFEKSSPFSAERQLTDANVLFSTEGHVFLLSSDIYGPFKESSSRRKRTNLEKSPVCQIVNPMSAVEYASSQHSTLLEKYEQCQNDPSICESVFPKPSLHIFHGTDHQLSFKANPAAFGEPLDIHPIVSLVVVMPDSHSPKTLSTGCQPFKKKLSDKFVILRRGECSFVVKARNVQEAGGRGVLVRNYRSSSNEKDAMLSSQYSILTDDGTGQDIRIPTVMLSYSDMIYLQRKLVRWRKKKDDSARVVAVLFNSI